MKQPIDLARQFLAVADNDIMDALDRERAKAIVNAVRKWADEQINGPTPP